MHGTHCLVALVKFLESKMTRATTRTRTKSEKVSGEQSQVETKDSTQSVKPAKEVRKNTKGMGKKLKIKGNYEDDDDLPGSHQNEDDANMELTDFEDLLDDVNVEDDPDDKDLGPRRGEEDEVDEEGEEEEEEEEDDDDDEEAYEDEDGDETDEEDREEENESKSDKQVFKCAYCDYTFGRKSMLKRHVRIHTGERPYACDKCDSKFTQLGGLKTHMLSKHRDQMDIKDRVMYQCHHCDKSFIIKERLRIHLRVHTGELPYVCHICSKKFRRNGGLLQHLRRHVGMRPYTCEICKASYYNSTNLKTHMKRHMGVQDYVCDLCGKGFTRRDGLRKHLACLHYDQCAFRCSICNKSFKGHILSHLRMHLKEKPFKCDECGMRFVQSSQLVVHKRTHSGAKPYPCQICKVAFSHSSALRMHIRRHTGEKPVKCLLCPAAFVQLPHLKKHMRCIHKTDKPYVCVPCYEFFKTKAELEEHTTANKCEPAPPPGSASTDTTVTTPAETEAEAGVEAQGKGRSKKNGSVEPSVPKVEAAAPAEDVTETDGASSQTTSKQAKRKSGERGKVNGTTVPPLKKSRKIEASAEDSEESVETDNDEPLILRQTKAKVSSRMGRQSARQSIKSSLSPENKSSQSHASPPMKTDAADNGSTKTNGNQQSVTTLSRNTRSSESQKSLPFTRSKKLRSEDPSPVAVCKVESDSGVTVNGESNIKLPSSASSSRRSSFESKRQAGNDSTIETMKPSEKLVKVRSFEELSTETKSAQKSLAGKSKVPICEPLKTINNPQIAMVEEMMKRVTERLKAGIRSVGVVVRSMPMPIEKIRMLLAILLTRISTPDRLKSLGFGKILIDDVLCASIISSGRAPCDKTDLSERDVILKNVQILLDWTVPKVYMERFKRENRSTEDLLEELTS